MVLTLSLGSCCPAKDSEARTPYKTAGNDFATEFATNFARSGCLSPLSTIWIRSDGDKVWALRHRRRSVTRSFIRAVPWLWMFQQNDKTNAIETTYILRGFASHIRHLNRSEWGKTLQWTEKTGKRGRPNCATKNEEAQCLHIFSFILWYKGRGRAAYAPVLRLSVGEGRRGNRFSHSHVLRCL